MKHHAQQFEIQIPNEPFQLIQETTLDGQRVQSEREAKAAALKEQESQQQTLFGEG